MHMLTKTTASSAINTFSYWHRYYAEMLVLKPYAETLQGFPQRRKCVTCGLSAMMGRTYSVIPRYRRQRFGRCPCAVTTVDHKVPCLLAMLTTVSPFESVHHPATKTQSFQPSKAIAIDCDPFRLEKRDRGSGAMVSQGWAAIGRSTRCA